MKACTQTVESPGGVKLHDAFESAWNRCIANLTTATAEGSYDFFLEENLKPVLMPVTTGSVSSPMGLGSDSMPVKIDLMGDDTYLADSMQFHLEYMLRFHQQGVWYLMSTFRGEDPDTRHLNQFFHAEAEIPGGLEDVMQLIERYVKHLAQHILKHCSDDVLEVAEDLDHLEKLYDLKAIPRVTFSEVKKEFKNHPEFFTKHGYGIESVSTAGEIALMKEHGGVVWLTHFPHKAVPFYQARDVVSGNALCADLLMGIGETVGCGERHTQYREVLSSLKDHQVNPADYDWYMQMKRVRPLQTAGFGLGIERFLLWVLKHRDIRDIPLFKRLKGQPCHP